MDEGTAVKVRGIQERIEAISEKVQKAITVVDEVVSRPEAVVDEDPRAVSAGILGSIQDQLMLLDSQAQHLLEQIIAVKEKL